MLIAYNASFVARTFTGDPKHSQDIIRQAIEHKGFSFVEVLSPCVTFRGKDQYKLIREKVTYLDEAYNPSDEVAAFDVANHEDQLALGVIYKKPRPTYGEIVEENVTKKQKLQQVPVPINIDDLLQMFRP